MNPYLVRVGSRGFNLSKINYWEEPGPETDVEEGHVRMVIEPGIAFDLDGECARQVLGHLDRLMRGLPPASEGRPMSGTHRDPATGEPLP